MRSACIAAWLLAGCFGTGSLDLELTLPTEPDLKPTGMTTVTVLATSPEIDPIANRTVLTGQSFKAGELPVGDDMQINVLLHDVSNRLVGLGEAPELVDIDGEKQTRLTIPVRRPFIYASSGTALYTFDPTLDPRNPKFQGRIQGLTSPAAGVSVGGDRFVIAGGSQIQVVETATHKVIGSAITLPGTVNDVAPVPSVRKVAVAHGGGIAIVNIDTGEVTNAAVGPVDRVTVGPASDGKTMFAYGLVDRVAPSETPLVPCTGTSSVVAVSVDAPMVTAPKQLPAAVSAIAAAPAAVFAALPCMGQIARIDGDPTTEIGQLTLTMMSQLKNAAAVAVFGDRAYAAGTTPSTPVCAAGTCNTQSSTACPETSTNRVSYVTNGARLLIQSLPIAGGDAITVELPERRETMVDARDMARQHAQVLHPLGTVPLDLVVLPGGQYVSVVSRSSFFIESLINQAAQLVLPCLKTQSADWVLVDMASSSVAQRVRTHCEITNMRQGAYFDMWECDQPAEAERSTQGDYVPVSVGALFGAR